MNNLPRNEMMCETCNQERGMIFRSPETGKRTCERCFKAKSTDYVRELLTMLKAVHYPEQLPFHKPCPACELIDKVEKSQQLEVK